MTQITNFLKKEEFKCTKTIAKPFEKIKRKLTTAPALCLSDFLKIVEIACDTSGIDVYSLLIQ